MSLLEFERRWPLNIQGRFYVSNQCLDCDLCRQLAPTVFARNEEDGYSYVKKQPETDSELSAALEAVQGCCVETIHDDGHAFDWQATLARPELSYPNKLEEVSYPDGTLEELSQKTLPAEKKEIGTRSWWKFW